MRDAIRCEGRVTPYACSDTRPYILLRPVALRGLAVCMDRPRPDAIVAGGVTAEPGQLGILASTAPYGRLNGGLWHSGWLCEGEVR